MTNPVEYPTPDEIHAMHRRIVARDPGSEPGIRTPAAVKSALTYISEGYYGERPESIHAKAAHLMRLIVADHPYVDGNKRTALSAAAYLYDLNGYELPLDDEIRGLLRDFAGSEGDIEAAKAYLRERATEKQ